jgi:hypothetical protein
MLGLCQYKDSELHCGIEGSTHRGKLLTPECDVNWMQDQKHTYIRSLSYNRSTR